MKNNKYYILNLMFGDYESSIHIFKGESIKEIIENNEELKNCKIKDFNYNPKLKLDKFNYLNDYNNPLFKKDFSFSDNSYKNHIVFNNSYEILLKNASRYEKGVSGELFLQTNKPFYDWIEIYGNFPKNYKFSDVHSG